MPLPLESSAGPELPDTDADSAQNTGSRKVLSKGWWLSLLPALAAFLPALVLGWLVMRNASDTPVWDDWERGPLIEKFSNGTLTFNDLYAPHIDHRILFPRIIILTLNALSGGDLRWEIGCVFLTGLLAAIGVWQLARATVFAGKTNWGFIFLANLVILSPIAWDNWLWGVQIAFLLPMTCTIWALVTVLKPWRWWQRLLVCLALAIVGTHSFGHGFAVWPAVFGLALLVKEFHATAAERRWFLSSWSVVGAAVVLCYVLVDFTNVSDVSHSYGQGPGAPPPSAVNYQSVLANLEQASQFMLILAGNGFARLHIVDPQTVAPWIGVAWLTLFALLGSYALKKRWRNDGAFWDRALPWLALGCAALLGMAAVTIGRLNLAGTSRAASIRYVSISQYLAVAVLFLLFLWWRQSSSGAKLQRWKAQWGGVIAGCFVGFMAPAWNFGAQMMELCGEARLQAKAALIFINHWDPEEAYRLDKEAAFVRKNANLLESLGCLRAPLAKTLELVQFKPLEKARPHSQAMVEDFYHLGGTYYSMHGYARLPDRPADGVLLTWETADIKPRIFTMAEPTNKMVQHPYPNDLELVGRMKPDKYDFCRWNKGFSLQDSAWKDVPQGADILIRVWMFDADKLRAYRVRGAWSLAHDGGLVVVEEPESEESREKKLDKERKEIEARVAMDAGE